MEPKDFIFKYFKIDKMTDIDEKEILSYNYIEKGLIDSFGVIELISTVESAFDFVFSENDFKAERFSTIGGLIKIIEERRKPQ